MQNIKLNLGCGSNKIKGYINIDIEKSCKPDKVHDFTKSPLPYKENTVDEIIFFHCIEHIEKILHRYILSDFYRVLKLGGTLIISYPDFWKCAQNWHNNYLGKKSFWEATLYGRQLYDSDYHVCAMDSIELAVILDECGFKNIQSFPEMYENYNTITKAIKGPKPMIGYEELIASDMRAMVVK